MGVSEDYFAGWVGEDVGDCGLAWVVFAAACCGYGVWAWHGLFLGFCWDGKGIVCDVTLVIKFSIIWGLVLCDHGYSLIT